jgi:hypothetical protein
MMHRKDPSSGCGDFVSVQQVHHGFVDVVDHQAIDASSEGLIAKQGFEQRQIAGVVVGLKVITAVAALPIHDQKASKHVVV